MAANFVKVFEARIARMLSLPGYAGLLAVIAFQTAERLLARLTDM
jgi:hypothetical protein